MSAIVLFFHEAGSHLLQLVTEGSFKDPGYAQRQIVAGVVFAALLACAAVGVQYLADIKWLLKNKVDRHA
ncbi:hypothetical protein [Qipengyuania qiaonensis]|uniref:Uncharacterized protein n=1 Tax=Qipengyuania qiaonensis TaxID=2867240 RepID=A0ABS7J5N9_9SPHN|nr:hypothetical protein [Qipengyuania qiaonensis]MBX7481184.1 hypothetical protein [Qipengyuania qiaonensis]